MPYNLNVGFPNLAQVKDKAREFRIGCDLRDVFEDDDGLARAIHVNLSHFGIDQPS
jgi:hypothetical protein